jgi:hypothetical protein
MDNGSPWGTQSPVPSALALWLVGLGIVPIYGRPARSTDNAVVERSHGVLAPWVEAAHCADLDQCRTKLAWAVQTQRERYPAVRHQSRAQAFPALFTNVRGYTLEAEAALWSLERVRTYLSQFSFRRKVEQCGQVTLFASTYSVGRAHRRTFVEFRLDAVTGEWQVRDEYGREVRRCPSRELDYTRISQLQLGKRRKT